MENTFSLWARKSFAFGSPQLIDDRPRISTASPCLCRWWCQPSLITTYHGGAYPHKLLCFARKAHELVALKGLTLQLLMTTISIIKIRPHVISRHNPFWRYVGSALAERVRQGEVGGCYSLGDSAWQLLQLAVEKPWSAPGGPFFCFLAQMGIETSGESCLLVVFMTARQIPVYSS